MSSDGSWGNSWTFTLVDADRRMVDRSQKILELLRLPENSQCADCGQPDPVWASCNVGVFVCLQCSGVHRISSIGRVKSTQLDYLEHDLIEFMKSHGNRRAKDEFEACIPPFYYRPTEKDCMVLKEQWIRAKYERREFTGDKKCAYAVDYKEGFLWKKGRDNGQFQKRLFIYADNEGVLKYYTGDKKSGPKGNFPIQTLNAMFQGEKIKHQNGMEITCVQDGHTRSIYVYHDDGAEIVTWYNVLRYARYKYLKKTFPDTPETELIPKITRSYAKSGYMEKTGPTQKEAFKKRWFNLDSEERKLLYYKKPLVRRKSIMCLCSLTPQVFVCLCSLTPQVFMCLCSLTPQVSVCLCSLTPQVSVCLCSLTPQVFICLCTLIPRCLVCLCCLTPQVSGVSLFFDPQVFMFLFSDPPGVGRSLFSDPPGVGRSLFSDPRSVLSRPGQI
ncbi:arf-GAP with dual PH domain-containing protein 2 isoform X2 [Pyxicephalus adspersus]|uniref:arf-GAP with dual PH domain-containing protein 2 isoform X2 n=2 Tax=Pyxicephalus adspersus TaxID=30357 RepID=UPI003B5AF473